tara:strand:- start:222 stop:674 length:453 start_codon:yes stop_codon:yes gene_type:complete
MTTKKEREIIQQKSLDIIKEAAGDNQWARAYLWMLARITRTLDDLYDNDQHISREELLEVLDYLFIKLPTNPFYVAHQDVLVSQHLSMWNAWMAANQAESGDELDQIYAHVWRDTHQEVIPIVALLTQGHDQMNIVSNKVRALFKKQLGE